MSCHRDHFIRYWHSIRELQFFTCDEFSPEPEYVCPSPADYYARYNMNTGSMELCSLLHNVEQSVIYIITQTQQSTVAEMFLKV